MAGKFAKISWLEGAVLLLTACFAAGTLLWFHTVQPEEVQVTKNPTAQTASRRRNQRRRECWRERSWT